jgi:hypothetical protein
MRLPPPPARTLSAAGTPAADRSEGAAPRFPSAGCALVRYKSRPACQLPPPEILGRRYTPTPTPLLYLCLIDPVLFLGRSKATRSAGGRRKWRWARCGRSAARRRSGWWARARRPGSARAAAGPWWPPTWRASGGSSACRCASGASASTPAPGASAASSPSTARG